MGVNVLNCKIQLWGSFLRFTCTLGEQFIYIYTLLVNTHFFLLMLHFKLWIVSISEGSFSRMWTLCHKSRLESRNSVKTWRLEVAFTKMFFDCKLLKKIRLDMLSDFLCFSSCLDFKLLTQGFYDILAVLLPIHHWCCYNGVDVSVDGSCVSSLRSEWQSVLRTTSYCASHFFTSQYSATLM